MNAHRASTLLEIKSIKEDDGIIEGIATTPTPDRIGDIVEPKGVEFALPLPLLWQHSSGHPIGKVLSADVSDEGIRIRAKIERGLLPEIDRAWAMIKSGLVRGLSIGFRGLDVEPINPKDPWGALHFKRWEWYELSAVTIPANVQANIQAIKSAYGAALGNALVRLNSPGASGLVQLKGPPEMATIQERLSSWEAKRAAAAAARANLLKTAEDDGDRTLTDEESTEYDKLGGQVKQIDAHIKRLREEADEVKATAKPVSEDVDLDVKATPRETPHILNLRSEEREPGIGFARYIKCHILAKGNPTQAVAIGRNMYPNDARIQKILAAEAKNGQMISMDSLDAYQKGNVTGANTLDSAWMGALVNYNDIASEFLDFIRPQTIIGQFGTGGIPSLTRVPFKSRIGAQTSGGTGYWVGEGKPKPLTSFAFTNYTMDHYKVAVIAVVTMETLKLATPSADMLVRNALRGAVIERHDRDFIDPDFAGSANVSPASITYGATTAAAGGTTNAFVVSDTGTAVDSMLAAFPDATLGGLVWLMSARTAYRLGQGVNSLGQPQFPGLSIRGGQLGGIPVITSEYLAYGGGLSPASNNLLVLVHAPSILLADDGEVAIDASGETALQMLDNPTNDVTTPTATSMVSMYQTNSVAIRAERAINWRVARPGAVYYITNVAYSGLPS